MRVLPERIGAGDLFVGEAPRRLPGGDPRQPVDRDPEELEPVSDEASRSEARSARPDTSKRSHEGVISSRFRGSEKKPKASSDRDADGLGTFEDVLHLQASSSLDGGMMRTIRRAWRSPRRPPDSTVTGSTREGRVFWNPTTSLLYTHALARGDAPPRRGRAARRRHRPPHRPLAEGQVRRAASRTPRTGSGGATSTSRSRRSTSTGCARRSSRTSNAGDLYVVDAFAGADPAHRLCVRVSPSRRGTRSSRKTLFIDPTEDELDDFEPDALVLHAPGRRGRPGRGRDAQRDVRRPPPDARRGADRRHATTRARSRSRSSRS